MQRVHRGASGPPRARSVHSRPAPPFAIASQPVHNGSAPRRVGPTPQARRRAPNSRARPRRCDPSLRPTVTPRDSGRAQCSRRHVAPRSDRHWLTHRPRGRDSHSFSPARAPPARAATRGWPGTATTTRCKGSPVAPPTGPSPCPRSNVRAARTPRAANPRCVRTRPTRAARSPTWIAPALHPAHHRVRHAPARHVRRQRPRPENHQAVQAPRRATRAPVPDHVGRPASRAFRWLGRSVCSPRVRDPARFSGIRVPPEATRHPSVKVLARGPSRGFPRHGPTRRATPMTRPHRAAPTLAPRLAIAVARPRVSPPPRNRAVAPESATSEPTKPRF